LSRLRLDQTRCANAIIQVLMRAHIR